MNDLEKLDTALSAQDPSGAIRGVTVGSITFGPIRANPCYSPAEVLLQADVARLRAGNAELMKQLNAALAHVRELERVQHVGQV